MITIKKSAVVILTAAFLLVLLTGCTQLERDGISPIPQNSPGAWEINPYGDFRN